MFFFSSVKPRPLQPDSQPQPRQSVTTAANGQPAPSGAEVKSAKTDKSSLFLWRLSNSMSCSCPVDWLCAETKGGAEIRRSKVRRETLRVSQTIWMEEANSRCCFAHTDCRAGETRCTPRFELPQIQVCCCRAGPPTAHKPYMRCSSGVTWTLPWGALCPAHSDQ